ncbi:MAG: tetratricopeptide repeat protein [Candidatus Eremiobacteraeota bacterium]|nr:tetratricopeptide repeat protein [Candidatus Eremiobacteraeota bacterium]
MREVIREAQGALPRRVLIPALAALVLVTFLTFSPVLRCGFINWDDNKYVTGSSLVKDLSPDGLKRIFTSTVLGWYTPLSVLSFALEYRFYQLNPFPYHVHNLLLHILNTLLVFWLIYLISGDFLASLVASLFFALSPLRVQSVAWISERKGLLCALFFFASFISYIYWVKRHRKRFYFASLLLFFLSILSKPQGSLLPLCLLLYDHFVGKRLAIAEKLPYLLGFLAAGPVEWLSMARKSSLEMNYPQPLIQVLCISCYLVLFYLWKILVPLDLHEIYPLDPEFVRHLPMAVWLSPLLLLALAALFLIAVKRVALKAPRHADHALFGMAFFLLNILPFLKLLPVNATSLIALRQTYLPTLGLFLILGEGFSWLFRERGRQRAALCLLAGIVLAVQAAAAHRQCGVYKDSLTFWNHVLERHPCFVRGLSIRGSLHYEQGNPALARRDFERALAEAPSDGDVHGNLGILGLAEGDCERARTHLDFAIARASDDPAVWYYRGNIYQGERAFDKAVAMYQKALSIDPLYLKPYVNLGNIYSEQGRQREAVKMFTKALSIDSASPKVYYNRGNACFRNEQYRDALKDYTRALALQKDYWDAYRNRALVLFVMEEYQAALRDVRTLQEKEQPLDPRFLDMLNEAVNRQIPQRAPCPP